MMICDGVGNVGNGGTDGAELDVFEAPFYTDCINNKVNAELFPSFVVDYVRAYQYRDAV